MDCSKNPELFNENDPTVIAILSALYKFHEFYRALHRYISIVLCLFGLVANSIHVWILTRPKMLQSSVHTVLICIAFADIGTMSSYGIYLLRYEFGASSTGGYSYCWVLLLKIHVLLSIALHAISLYLLVFMAYIRLCSIQARHSRLFETRVAGFISLIIALAVFLLCIPTLLAHDIQVQQLLDTAEPQTSLSVESTVLKSGSNHATYSIGFSKMFTNNDCFLLKLNLWLIGIIMKVVPCVLLLILTYCLLIKLEVKRKKRVGLLRNKAKDGAYKDRTTYILLVMLSLFLCTELPQGIIAILNAIYIAQFHFYVYLMIADVLDVLSLINCYVGFTVYFCTSSSYRETFYSVLPRFCFSFQAQKKQAEQRRSQPQDRSSTESTKALAARGSRNFVEAISVTVDSGAPEPHL